MNVTNEKYQRKVTAILFRALFHYAYILLCMVQLMLKNKDISKIYIGKSANTSKSENYILCYGSFSNIMNHRHFLIILQN